MRRLLAILALLLWPLPAVAAGTLVCQGGTCTGPLAPLTTANTWTALQTFSSGLTVSGGQLLIQPQPGGLLGLAFDGATTTGMQFASSVLQFKVSNNVTGAFDANGPVIHSALKLQFGSNGILTSDLFLLRDAANTLAQKNGTTAQEFRVYGTTTGNKYAALSHDGTNPILGSSSGALKVNATAVTPATTGTRYLCIDTAGVVASSASACSGT